MNFKPGFQFVIYGELSMDIKKGNTLNFGYKTRPGVVLIGWEERFVSSVWTSINGPLFRGCEVQVGTELAGVVRTELEAR